MKKTIAVRRETVKRLRDVKETMELRSLDQLINIMLDKFEIYLIKKEVNRNGTEKKEEARG